MSKFRKATAIVRRGALENVERRLKEAGVGLVAILPVEKIIRTHRELRLDEL